MLTLPALTLLGLLSASSSLAAPVTPAVVGTVHCNVTSIGNSLHLLSGPAGEYTGIDSPLGIYTDLTNDGTSDLGHHADEDAEETAAENAVKFDFYNCDSKFMGAYLIALGICREQTTDLILCTQATRRSAVPAAVQRLATLSCPNPPLPLPAALSGNAPPQGAL